MAIIKATGLASLASLLAQQAPTSASPQDAGLNARTANIQASAQANLQNELVKEAARKAKRKAKKARSLKLGLTVAGAAFGGIGAGAIAGGLGAVGGAKLGADIGGSIAGIAGGEADPAKTISGTLGKLATKMMPDPTIVPSPPITSTPPIKPLSRQFDLNDFAQKLDAGGASALMLNKSSTDLGNGWFING